MIWYNLIITKELGGAAMDNQEFQRIVLEELKGIREGQKSLELRQRNLEEGQKSLELRQRNLEEGQKSLELRQKNLEEGQESLKSRQMTLELEQQQLIEKIDSMEKTVNVIYEQTIFLTESKQEMDEKMDKIIENHKSMIEIIGEHEVEIRSLRRRPV